MIENPKVSGLTVESGRLLQMLLDRGIPETELFSVMNQVDLVIREAKIEGAKWLLRQADQLFATSNAGVRGDTPQNNSPQA